MQQYLKQAPTQGTCYSKCSQQCIIKPQYCSCKRLISATKRQPPATASSSAGGAYCVVTAAAHNGECSTCHKPGQQHPGEGRYMSRAYISVRWCWLTAGGLLISRSHGEGISSCTTCQPAWAAHQYATLGLFIQIGRCVCQSMRHAS